MIHYHNVLCFRTIEFLAQRFDHSILHKLSVNDRINAVAEKSDPLFYIPEEEKRMELSKRRLSVNKRFDSGMLNGLDSCVPM